MTGEPAGLPQSAAWRERVLAFECGGDRLYGVLASPGAAPARPIAVLIVVGGPQYRVGSHRQFVLLARRLAGSGYPALRFDCRGMGDSEGEPRAFDAIGDDIRAAIDAACDAAGVTALVVFGLCDAASAALLHAADDRRVRALALVNPWLRSDATLATTYVRHYYGRRLLQREFWHRLLSGGLAWRASMRSATRDVGAALARRLRPAPSASTSFQARMAAGLQRFPGRVLLVLSGDDYTAREFVEYTRSEAPWPALLAARRIERCEVAGADHTFSDAASRSALEDRMLAWLDTL